LVSYPICVQIALLYGFEGCQLARQVKIHKVMIRLREIPCRLKK
jgi:hypothetical protein